MKAKNKAFTKAENKAFTNGKKRAFIKIKKLPFAKSQKFNFYKSLKMELKKVQQLNFSQIIQKLNFCKTINNKQIKNKKNRAFIKGANFNFYKSTKVELLQKAQDAQSTQSMKFCTFKLRPVKFSISSSSKNLNYTKVCADFTAKNF